MLCLRLFPLSSRSARFCAFLGLMSWLVEAEQVILLSIRAFVNTYLGLESHAYVSHQTLSVHRWRHQHHE